MKKVLFIVVFSLSFFSIKAQDKSQCVISESLSFLDRKLKLNFENGEELILVNYLEEHYLVNKYYSIESSAPKRIRIIYSLVPTGDHSYSFSLIWSGEYKGSFKYKNGKFSNFRYLNIQE